MEWKFLSLEDAKRLTDKWAVMNEHVLRSFMQSYRPDLSSEYMDIRCQLIKAFKANVEHVKNIVGGDSNKTYLVDLDLGLAIYSIFDKKGLCVRDASRNEFWRYIACIVMPDIIFMRMNEIGKKERKKSNDGI